MTMKLFHLNPEAMSHDDYRDAMMGTRNREGVELFKRLMAADGYLLVAEIDGDDLDHAWNVSQELWSVDAHDGVRPFGASERPHRSSMVGDIIVLDEVMHVVDMIGFAEIGPFPEATSPSP